MRSKSASGIVGGTALVAIVGGLTLVAAKLAREDARQEDISRAVQAVPGVAEARIDVRTAVLPWATSRVRGTVYLAAEGIDQFEERFDDCVRAARVVMDDHQDFTASIELRAQPVDAVRPEESLDAAFRPAPAVTAPD